MAIQAIKGLKLPPFPAVGKVPEYYLTATATYEKLPERPELPLPEKIEEVEALIRAEYADMFKLDGTTWYVELQYAFDRMLHAYNYGEFGVVGGGGCAAIHSVRVEDYFLIQHRRGVPVIDVYRDRRRVGRWSNDDIRRTGSGRMGGLRGWDRDNFAVAGQIRTVAEGVMANIGGLLAKYKEPPAIPFFRRWRVPVMVTRGHLPGRPFPMSSLFSYVLATPSVPVFTVTSVVRYGSPERMRLWVGLWDPGRAKAGGSEVELPSPGTYRVTITFMGVVPGAGFVEITPYNPPGITVTEVDSVPPATGLAIS